MTNEKAGPRQETGPSPNITGPHASPGAGDGATPGEQVRQWLDLSYPASPDRDERYHLGVLAADDSWTGRAYTREHLPAAVEQAERAGPSGIYLSTCTYRPDAGNSRRAADTAWCYGMWSDLDIDGPGHKHDPAKHGGLILPPDEESARKIVAASGLPEPTAWIHSGGGLYAWWLLDAPVPAQECGELSRQWHAALARVAAVFGWHYGTAVSDLARVLRLPGTINRKVPGEPRPARLLSTDGPRYSIEQLRKHAEVVAPPAQPAPQSRTAADSILFSAPGQPTGNGALDAFNKAATWAQILQPHGWTHVYRHDDGHDLWRHPNATSPKSAVTGRTPADTLECYSDNAGLPTNAEGGTLTKAFVWAALRQGTPNPHMGQAAAELAAVGYGGHPRDRLGGAEITAHNIATFEANGMTPPQPPSPEEQWAAKVAGEALRLHLRAEARELFEAEQHARLWTPPPAYGSLTDELALPDEDDRWRLDGLLGVGHNAVLVAGRKTGKTTMVGNLVRSYVDGEPFLGRFPVTPADAAVAVFNYEVDERQYRRWLREVGIANTGRVHVLHLRGRSLPLKDARVRAWVATWLRDRGVGLWIVDPYSRAYVGSLDNGNDEAQVGAFLDTLDVIKTEARVSELVMPVHTPKARADAGEETAIGSQRLEGWPDSMWYLTRDLSTGLRFLRAEGRDVDVDEEQLTYDPATRRLTMGGHDRAGTRQHADVAALVAYVTEHPGCTGRDIRTDLGWGPDRLTRARTAAGGQIRLESGERRSQLHYPADHTGLIGQTGLDHQTSSSGLVPIGTTTTPLLEPQDHTAGRDSPGSTPDVPTFSPPGALRTGCCGERAAAGTPPVNACSLCSKSPTFWRRTAA